MNGFRNLYKVFRESRKAAQERATVAVIGEPAEVVAELAATIEAQRNLRGAEITLEVRDSGSKVWVSGKGVEDPLEVELPEDRDFGTLAESRFARRVVGALDEDFVVPLAKSYPFFRRSVCEELIRNNARQNAVIGALPVPGADLPVMTANQGRMVLMIAAAYGEELTLQRARELVGVLAAGFGLRAVSRQVLKFVPFGGWAAAGAIGYAGTVAMGRAAMLYFERGGQRIGEKEMEGIRERAAKEGRDFISRFRNRK